MFDKSGLRFLRKVTLFLIFFGFSCLLRGQISSAGGGKQVAFVYVSSNSSQIYAFSANSKGTLTAVSAPPFSANVQDMAVSQYGYVFGDNGVDIFSYSIAQNGGLTLAS